MPYPNNHSCQLISPEKVDIVGSKPRTSENGKTYRVLFGILKAEKTSVEQTYRYPTEEWSASEAKAHCEKHNGILFEPAVAKQEKINSPTFAYQAVYGKNPDKFLPGRISGDTEHKCNEVMVDEHIECEWIKELDSIHEIEMRASCEGHSEERVTYIVFRLKEGLGMCPEDIVIEINKIEGLYSKTDIGSEGLPRVVVAGRTYYGQSDWDYWWENMIENLKRIMEGISKEKNEQHAVDTFNISDLEKAKHRRDNCMMCKSAPAYEVLWAEGMGHAWFCKQHLKEWASTGDGWHEIDAIKEVMNGKAEMLFKDNTNPNLFSKLKEILKSQFSPEGVSIFKRDLSRTKQLEEWVKGNPIHNTEFDECVPDFSCCRGKEFMADILKRKKFQESYLKGDKKIVLTMLGDFLGDAIADHFNAKVETSEKIANEESAWLCECLDCHKTIETDKHCFSIKCPVCGGQMRRKARPGLGDEDKAKFEQDYVNKEVSIFDISKNKDEHIICGIVYEPGNVEYLDTDGDYTDKREILAACYDYMENCKKFRLMHKFEFTKQIVILENVIAPVDFTMRGYSKEMYSVKKGTWYMILKVNDPSVWRRIKQGEITGLSMAGTAMFI